MSYPCGEASAHPVGAGWAVFITIFVASGKCHPSVFSVIYYPLIRVYADRDQEPVTLLAFPLISQQLAVRFLPSFRINPAELLIIFVYFRYCFDFRLYALPVGRGFQHLHVSVFPVINMSGPDMLKRVVIFGPSGLRIKRYIDIDCVSVKARKDCLVLVRHVRGERDIVHIVPIYNFVISHQGLSP